MLELLKESRSGLGLGFLGGPRAPDYGRRLTRLRWRRASGPAGVREFHRADPAPPCFTGAAAWLVVQDEDALPLPGEIPAPASGSVLFASGAVTPMPALHTLRELETSTCRPAETAPGERGFAALLFRLEDFPPSSGETVGTYLDRLSAPPTPRACDPRFGALRLDLPGGRDRPEVTRHIPTGATRLLDVGCGAGAASAAAKSERKALRVTGIEREPSAAARARACLDRVIEEDAGEALTLLASEGQTFDAFLFADVLEHTADPIPLLAEARRLAAPGAQLIASVPNVGHLSLVRDLLLGRFDPVPAGLADAGHLRWFARGFLREALEEAGWRVVSVSACPGAPSPEAEDFLSWFSEWPDADRASLETYQWIAVARAEN